MSEKKRELEDTDGRRLDPDLVRDEPDSNELSLDPEDRPGSLENDDGLAEPRLGEDIAEAFELNDENATEEPDSAEGNEEDLYSAAGRDVYTAGRDIKVASRDSIEAGRDVNIYGETELVKFDSLSLVELSRLKDVFVRPEGFSAARRQIESERVLLVFGVNHTGKWACAANLALRFSKEVQRYPRRPNSVAPLLDVAVNESFPSDAAVLVQDCFPGSLRRRDLETSGLAELKEILKKKNSVLILTGEVAGEEVADLPVLKVSAQVEDLKEVMRRHLLYYREQGGIELRDEQVEFLLGEGWDRLETLLQAPFQINKFCLSLVGRAVGEQDGDSWQEALLRWATEIALAGRLATRAWFDRLPRNDKLFALMAFLFTGAERRWLENLHRGVVRRLKGEELRFVDPRENGLEDTLERLNLEEIGGRLEFQDRSYLLEIEQQVRNRHHLLWDVIAPFLELNQVGEEEGWGEPWKRQVLGFGLGRIGIHDPAKLLRSLDEMAADGNKLRAVIPGYAFQQIVWQGAPRSDWALDLLTTWIYSWDHRKMWAAGAALWRVYLAALGVAEESVQRKLLDETLARLRKLGVCLGRFNVEVVRRESEGESEVAQRLRRLRMRIWGANFRAVVVAMWHVVLADPLRGSEELAQWLRQSNDLLVSLGRRTGREIFESLSLKLQRPSSTLLECLPKIVGPLLEQASDDSHDVEIALLTLRAWLHWESSQARLLAVFVDLATYSNSQVRLRLQSGLSRFWLEPRPAAVDRVARKVTEDNDATSPWGPGGVVRMLTEFWCESTEEPARRIARIVLARCLAMEGVLPSLPSMGTGVAIVDPGPLLALGDREGASDAAWRLVSLLDSRLDLTVLRMGEGEPFEFCEASQGGDLTPSFSGHRLLMPGIEALPVERKRSVFVLGPGVPHDLDDLLAETWLRELVLIGPARQLDLVDSSRLHHYDLDWAPSARNVDKVFSALETHWARALSRASASQWHKLVRACGGDVSQEPLPQLEATVELCSEAPTLEDEGDGDTVHRALVLCLWWSARDLPSCLEWIASGLMAQPAESSRDSAAAMRPAVAGAVARGLLNLFTAYPADLSKDGRAPTLLFELLAAPLAGQGSDGVDAVIRLVEHWLEDPVWTEFLTGDVKEGRSRLQRWTEEFLEDRPDVVRLLERRLQTMTSDDEQGLSALQAVVDRLKARQALEYPDPLPVLAAGQRYIFLVVDGDYGDEDAQRELAIVTSNLFARLTKVGTDERADDSEGHEEGVRGLEFVEAPFLPVVFRLGECRPFWAARKEPLRGAVLLPRAQRLTRLLGPLLYASRSIADRVAAVLLISTMQPLDLEDWADSHWWQKIRLYGGVTGPAVPLFNSVPKPTEHAGSGLAGGRFSVEARRLAAHLVRIASEGGMHDTSQD
ncbi:MAG: hypothetical protein AAGC60_05535 [Acidobacteriota bacterium]